MSTAGGVDVGILKPCPFCGSPARMTDATHKGGVCLIRCSNDDCDVRPSYFDRITSDAVEAWNTRALVTMVQARLFAEEG